MIRVPHSTWLTLATLLPFGLTGTALAADAVGGAEKASATEVGELIVTATRKEQSLSKIPVSVSAFTAAKMDIQGVKTFADVAKFTPGVTFGTDTHDISIRGISSTAGSGTTGVYIDDVPVQARNLGLNANNTLPAVFDLQRIEVLRGPQGTLFGAGSEGGTVRYITTQPSLTSFTGLAHSEVAATQHGGASYEFGAAVGGPIVKDKLGFRISAWGRRDGGWINRQDYQSLAITDAHANRADTYTLRAALTWAPSARLTITPAINFQKRDQHNYDNYWVSNSHPGAGQFFSGTPDRMADPDRFYLPSLKVEWNAGPVKIISDTSYYNRLERVNGYSGTLYNLSFFQHFLTSDPKQFSIYGYPSDPSGVACTSCAAAYPLLVPNGPNRANLPGLENYKAQNVIANRQENFTQEVRVQSNDAGSRLQWSAGAFFSFNRQRSKEEIRDPMLAQITQLLWGETVLQAWGEDLLANNDDYINDTRSKDRQFALFADASFAVTEKLKLNVGLRYAWTRFAFFNVNDGPQDLLLNGGIPANVNGGKSEKPFTPKFSLSYQLNHDDMVYATAAKGYRIGGATPPLPSNCGPGFPNVYNSDSVWSYELGTKDRFLDRKLQISASAYYIKWSNIQQSFQVPACGILFTTNSGEAVSKGFDFEGQWKVTRGLTLESSVGYTHARFIKTAIDANNDTLTQKGDSLPGSPWTVTLAAQYDFIMMGHDAFVRSDYEFSSQRTVPVPNEDPGTSFFDQVLVPDPATHQISARAGVSLAKIDLAIFVNNLTDSHPQLNLNHQDRATTLLEATTLRPRTFGLSANYKF